VVNHSLHAAARRAEALGWRYKAHRRGLERCSINLTTTEFLWDATLRSAWHSL